MQRTESQGEHAEVPDADVSGRAGRRKRKRGTVQAADGRDFESSFDQLTKHAGYSLMQLKMEI